MVCVLWGIATKYLLYNTGKTIGSIETKTENQQILIKRKVELSEDKVDEIINSAFLLFRGIVLGGVRTFA
jgi:hypothetical protein